MSEDATPRFGAKDALEGFLMWLVVVGFAILVALILLFPFIIAGIWIVWSDPVNNVSD